MEEEGFHSQCSIALVLPSDFDVDIVEIGIVQVATVMTDHTFGQTSHSDFLSFFDDTAERLEFDEAVAQVDNAIVQARRDVVDRQIGGLSQAATPGADSC
jgi:hypothetical protein